MKKYLQSFDETASYYRKRIIVIYAFLSFVFLVGGVVAFTLDSVTLMGRFSTAHFEGTAAYIAGTFCFFVTAYWISNIAQESHGGLLMSLIPFAGAAVISIALWAYKYG